MQPSRAVSFLRKYFFFFFLIFESDIFQFSIYESDNNDINSLILITLESFEFVKKKKKFQRNFIPLTDDCWNCFIASVIASREKEKRFDYINFIQYEKNEET